MSVSETDESAWEILEKVHHQKPLSMDAAQENEDVGSNNSHKMYKDSNQRRKGSHSSPRQNASVRQKSHSGNPRSLKLHLAFMDMTEVNTDSNEMKEEAERAPALEELPVDIFVVKPEPKLIIPKVIVPHKVNSEIAAVLLEKEDENDLNQHFFIDQVHCERPNWGSGWWFGRCAMVAVAVDLSALQSFPIKVANNGGIIFIFMYFICLVGFGYPGVVLEGVIGQHFQTALLGIWGLIPVLRGVGVAVFTGSVVFAAFAPSNAMWATIMIFDSWKGLSSGDLPWATCDNLWNSCRCKGIRRPDCPPHNETENSPALEYYLGRVLKIWKTQYGNPKEIHNFTENGNWSVSYGFHNHDDGFGELLVVPVLVILSIFVIILVLVSVNIKYSGYLYTFTTFYPLLALTILLCRGITLQGAPKAVRKYLAPDFSKLISYEAWFVALETSLYSLSLGAGIYVSIGSCNPLHHNLLADAMTVVVGDTTMNLLACVVTYAFNGHLTYYKNEELPDTYSGQSPAFVEFPEALAVITGASFFAVLYFLMIAVIASDTVIVSLQFLTYSLYEEYKRKYPNQTASSRLFSMPVIGFAFGCSLLCVTRGGYWIILFLIKIFGGIHFIFIIFAQEIAFAYIFGLEDLCVAFETVTGERPGLYYRTCWKFIRPLSVLMLFVVECVHQNLESYRLSALNSGLEAPPEFAYFAVSCDCIYMILMIAYMVYEYSKVLKSKATTCKQRTLFLISPEYDRDRILEDDDHGCKRAQLKHWLYFTDPRDPSCLEQIKLSIKSAIESLKKLTSKAKPRESTISLRHAGSIQQIGYTKANRKETRVAPMSVSETDESAWEILEKVHHQKPLSIDAVQDNEDVGSNNSHKVYIDSDQSRKEQVGNQKNPRKSARKKSILKTRNPHV